jgi:hypothetical protein
VRGLFSGAVASNDSNGSGGSDATEDADARPKKGRRRSLIQDHQEQQKQKNRKKAEAKLDSDRVASISTRNASIHSVPQLELPLPLHVLFRDDDPLMWTKRQV